MSNIKDIKNLDEEVYINFVKSIGNHIISKDSKTTLTINKNDVSLDISGEKNHTFIFEDLHCYWKSDRFTNPLDFSAAWVDFTTQRRLINKNIAEAWNNGILAEIAILQDSMIPQDVIEKLPDGTIDLYDF